MKEKFTLLVLTFWTRHLLKQNHKLLFEALNPLMPGGNKKVIHTFLSL